jgi:RNA-binding protein
MISTEKIKELKGNAKLLEPVVRIGKNGLTDEVIVQISKVLDKRRLIKIKFLRAFLENNDRKKAAEELAKKTRSLLVEQVGFVAVLYKEKNC